MSTKLTPDVAKAVKETVFEKADQVDYLAMSRTDSGLFLDTLVKDESVGVVISQFIAKSQIRHYIKDAILNRYSKDKTSEAKPSDLSPIIRRVYGVDTVETHKEEKISLFRATESGDAKEYVVVAEGTMLKWETALRKALLFTASKPFSENADNVHILLLLFARHKRVTPSDKAHLDKALALSNARAYVFGDK